MGSWVTRTMVGGSALKGSGALGQAVVGTGVDPPDVESMGLAETRLEIEYELGHLHMTPYRESVFGRVCYGLCILTSVQVCTRGSP